MSISRPQPFPYEIAGLATLVPEPVPIEEWAEKMKVPHRHRPGEHLTGEEMRNILGIRAKSWDPEVLGDIDGMVGLGGEALRSAGVAPSEVGAFIALPCTPYEVMLDQDAFKISRRLGLDDTLVPLQMTAGCAGLARAAAVASQLDVDAVLILTYSVPSVLAGSPEGHLNDLYRFNTRHPDSDTMWATAGTFSDSASALVLKRTRDDGTGTDTGTGTVLYSRDTDTFGENPLVRHYAGGLNHPPGTASSEELSCFGLDGPALADFYARAMMLNHRDLSASLPGYEDTVARVYTHQASPALVESFRDAAGLDPDKAPSNAREFGNLITTATTKMLHDDLHTGRVANGDLVCLSVVGAGPERGALIARVEIPHRVPPRQNRERAEGQPV
ncbi:3-oxoacyl-[acyl-carrier-protein] synthase III C-terminal domain-containing protein [Streptomyces sp. NPDC054796]